MMSQQPLKQYPFTLVRENGRDLPPFAYAIAAGEIDSVIKYINEGADINELYGPDCSPIILAAEFGHPEIVKLLLEHQVDLNLRYSSIWKPVGLLAIYLSVDARNNVSILSLLMPLVEVSHESLNNFLITAVNLGDVALASFLIRQGAGLHRISTKPLIEAIRQRNHDMIDLLLEHHSAQSNDRLGHPESYNEKPLFIATSLGYTEGVAALLTHGFSANPPENTEEIELINVIKKDTEWLQKHLFNYPASCLDTPLHIAAGNGYDEIFDLLLKAGAKVNVKDLQNQTPIDIVFNAKNEKILKILLSYGSIDFDYIHKNDKQRSYFLNLAFQCTPNANIIKNILRSAPPFARFEGKSALYLAVKYQCHEVVRTLLTNHHVVEGDTLLLAIQQGDLELTKSLLDKFPNLNALRTIHGDTALHIAAQEGHLAIVRELKSRKADANATNNMGKKPIEVAKEDIRLPMQLLTYQQEAKHVSLCSEITLLFNPNRILPPNKKFVPLIKSVKKSYFGDKTINVSDKDDTLLRQSELSPIYNGLKRT